MARTKAEVRAWLDSKVGTTVGDKSDARLNGQCVALIKGLMEFLGVPNPYAARGNAKYAGDNYIAQDIGEAGRGWLTVCVNRSMGLGYGHIWVDLMGEANYEQNGAKPLGTTKNTRPITQAQQFINFDKWITEGDNMADKLTRGQVDLLFVIGFDRPATEKEKEDNSKLDATEALKNVFSNNESFRRKAKGYDDLKSKYDALIASKPVDVDAQKKLQQIKEIVKE